MRYVELILQFAVSLIKKMPELLASVFATILIMSFMIAKNGQGWAWVFMVLYAILLIGVLLFNKWFDKLGDKVMNGLSLLSKADSAPLKENSFMLLMTALILTLTVIGICAIFGIDAHGIYRVFTFGAGFDISKDIVEIGNCVLVINVFDYLRMSLNETALFMSKQLRVVDTTLGDGAK